MSSVGSSAKSRRFSVGNKTRFAPASRATRSLSPSPSTRLRTPCRLICPRTTRPPAIGRPRTAEIRRSEEHTSELQSHSDLVCRLLLEKKKKKEQKQKID